MKTKLVVGLFFGLSIFSQMGCGNDCADSMKLTGKDPTSGVRVDVEAVDGHHTESGCNICIFNVTSIKLTKGAKVFQFTGDETLQDYESAQIKNLFPQLADADFDPLFIFISASVTENEGTVSIESTPDKNSFTVGDPAVYIDLTEVE